MSIRLAIVEDDATLREALTSFANSFEEVSDVYVYSNAEDFLQDVLNVKPDVVLQDIELPGMTGIECVRNLKSKFPGTNVVMCSVHENEDRIFDSICAGASGYIVKSSTPHQIHEAIMDAHKGGSPMSAHIARKVVEAFRKTKAVSPEFGDLTGREQEILQQLSQGLRYKEIAGNLYLSTETVRTHIRNIYVKLQVQSRAEAVNKIFGVR